MTEYFIGFILGVVIATVWICTALSEHVKFYQKYEECGKNIECFKRVIELQEEDNALKSNAETPQPTFEKD